MNTDVLIKKYRTHKNDTGSAAIQILLLSQQIYDLTGHFKTHHKDHDSRVGLLKMIGRRRKLLDYLTKVDLGQYKNLIADLKLRR